MGQYGFGNMVFTQQGLNLLAKVEAGAQLQFTRVAVGDGYLNGQDETKFTALIEQIMNLNISSVVVSGQGMAMVLATLSNSGLANGFYWREIGLFATDPQLGEILFGYDNSTGHEIYVPPASQNSFTAPVNIGAYVSNASSVTAVIDPSLVFVTQSENFTADPTQVPNGLIGTISQWFNWIANRIKAITGKTNWYDAPDITLANLNSHKSRHATGGADAMSPADIGAAAQTDLTTTNNTVNAHLAENASLTQAGHVQLQTTINTSETTALTPNGLNNHANNLVTGASSVHGLKIETGTFTPVIFGESVAGANTYTMQYGKYTKINSLIKFDLLVQLSVKDAAMAGNLRIGGLPYVQVSVEPLSSVDAGVYQGITLDTGYTELTPLIVSGQASIYLYESGSGKAPGALTPASLTPNVILRISGEYLTN